MKKIFVVMCCVFTIGAFAWHPGRPGWGPPPPPPPHHGYWGGGYNSGLYNAAAITSIVANGLSIYNNLTPRQTVVVQQPVVVPQQQVVTAPQVVTTVPTVSTVQTVPATTVTTQRVTYVNGVPVVVTYR